MPLEMLCQPYALAVVVHVLFWPLALPVSSTSFAGWRACGVAIAVHARAVGGEWAGRGQHEQGQGDGQGAAGEPAGRSARPHDGLAGGR